MLKKFFILCSGADKEVIASCSNGEQNKFAGIGATVFFTALMAGIAGYFALLTIFKDAAIAIGFGLIWGLLIFNLDRFIVSTIKKKDSFWSEFKQVLPRIALAIIIAIVISKPLEIKIFEKEINTVLLKEKNAMALANKKEITNYFQSDLDKNKTQIDSLKSNVQKKEKEVNDLYSIFITEAEGTTGSKKLGKGPVYKEKREKHDAALQELAVLKTTNQSKIIDLEAKAKTLQADLDKKIIETQPIIEGFDGLMARINALDKLPWLPSFFIMLLFLAIETTPIIAKLLSSKGEYDFKIEDAELSLLNMLSQNKYQSNLQRETDAHIYDKVYADLKEDNDLYSYKKKNAMEILQLQSDGFLDKQKRHI